MRGFGWRLVYRDWRTSLAAVLGVGMAVLIVFVEMGFMNGVVDSHLRAVSAARGELIAVDAKRSNLDKWDELLPIRLPQLGAEDGVESVRPVYQSGQAFRSSREQLEHRVIVLGLSPDDPPLDLQWSAETLAALRQPGVVLMDRMSRPLYGDLEPGQDVWLGERRMRLGGFFSLGPTVVNDGLLVMSESNFMGMIPHARPKMAILRVAGGADAKEVRARLAGRLGPEVQVFLKSELAGRETAYLMRVAPLGFLFGAGMAAGLFVGLVICYQVLYVAVRRRLKAFATLKAIGFGNGFVLGTVVQQALVIGIAGYALGVALALAAYESLAERTGLLFELSWPRAAAVCLACVLACVIAGSAAALRVLRCQPADLF